MYLFWIIINNNMEFDKIEQIVSYFDKIVNKNILNFPDWKFGNNYLELLIHFKLEKQLKIYLKLCFKSQLESHHSTIMRGDDSYTKVLISFVKKCLDDIFPKYSGSDNILENFKNLCKNSPILFKQICRQMFTKANKKKPNLGYTAVSSLVFFRYFIPKIFEFHKMDTKIISQCKKIQLELYAITENKMNQELVEFVDILVKDDFLNYNETNLTFSLRQYYVNLHLIKIYFFFQNKNIHSLENGDNTKKISRTYSEPQLNRKSTMFSRKYSEPKIKKNDESEIKKKSIFTRKNSEPKIQIKQKPIFSKS